MKKIELLAPAKDLESGKAAINHGADAVYTGAEKFGARKAAGNSLKDIEELTRYAHQYNAKVYATINTILYDHELREAEKLIHDLYSIGADAIIFQDFSLLEMNLPPIPLFASTQTHNYSVPKVVFLQNIGVKRVILARELSLAKIKEIKGNSDIELETFISGALCVSMSGQCYMSYAGTGRSANRGECSQSCRMLYSLLDRNGKTLIKDKYLLSLRDMNLEKYLEDLIDCGVSSFKIEGRLKDINYVKNTTAYFRKKIDNILLNKKEYRKSSSGKVTFSFEPDISKTFNRGFSEYFINDEAGSLVNLNTPKSIGEYLGDISFTGKDYFVLKNQCVISTGDGLCYITQDGVLSGINVNKISGDRVYSNNLEGNYLGQKIYRNNNIQFERLLARDKTIRKIPVFLELKHRNNLFKLTALDEDGNRAEGTFTEDANFEKNTIRRDKVIEQLSKAGETIFSVESVLINQDISLQLKISELNEIRREVLKSLYEIRLNAYIRDEEAISKNDFPYYKKSIDYQENVTNKLSEKFYRRHKVEEIQYGPEVTKELSNKVLMVTKYCIKNELLLCPFDPLHKKSSYQEPLYLADCNNRYKLEFHCAECEMHILPE
ncbi:MAG: U32 family peptidase [Ignavibacteriaceae bacterium]